MKWHATGPTGNTLHAALELREEPLLKFSTPDGKVHKTFAGSALVRAITLWLEEQDAVRARS